jgi:hypothetical protein
MSATRFVSEHPLSRLAALIDQSAARPRTANDGSGHERLQFTRTLLASRPNAGTRRMHPMSRSNEGMPDLRESLECLENGTAIETLQRIDDALDAADLGRAKHLERLLPQSIGAEPAVVDRLATLRILEGDLATAAALLGAAPQSTPRLDLLRAVVALRQDDMLTAFALANGETARRSLCLRIIAAVVSGLTAWEQGIRVGADTTAAVCEATREGTSATSGIGSAALTPALRTLGSLLPDDAPGTFMHAVRLALTGIAEDLGIPLPVPTAIPSAGTLGVDPDDRKGMNLRAA